MLEAKLLRDNLPEVAKKLATRGVEVDIEKISQLEAQRKVLQTTTQNLQNDRNTKSKSIGQAKASGQSQESIEALLKEVANLKDDLDANEKQLEEIQQQLQAIYDLLPNLPNESVPIGKDEHDNVEVRIEGKPTAFNFSAKDHVELTGASLDMDVAAKISGARFMVLQGKFARLHRALAQFMLDLHTQKHGYEEVYVPYLVSGKSMYGTGQLPKLKEDIFKIEDMDLWMIPTSEVAVTNLGREHIFEESELPKQYVCYSPCFRKEAGSYSKDIKGMFRQHQFDKVELVHFSKPEDSYSALENMLKHAETVLQDLRLPYRVMSLCTGDMGFCAAKTYDLEVWMPGQNKYREISSCSNTESFQARRLQSRYRTSDTRKVEYLHTLNGSGLAVGRTFIAVLENYQTEDGRVRVPDVLLPYMGGISVI